MQRFSLWLASSGKTANHERIKYRQPRLRVTRSLQGWIILNPSRASVYLPINSGKVVVIAVTPFTPMLADRVGKNMFAGRMTIARSPAVNPFKERASVHERIRDLGIQACNRMIQKDGITNDLD